MSSFNSLFAMKLRANAAGINQDLLKTSLVNPDQTYNSILIYN